MTGDLTANDEHLDASRHVHDLPIETKPTDDIRNGIKVTGARGLLSHLGQQLDLGTR